MTHSRSQDKYADKYPSLYESIPEKRKPKPRGKNTIIDCFCRLRTFFIWCNENGITDNRPFDKFPIEECTYGTPYYITLEERDMIYNVDLSDRPQLAIQRDIFVFHTLIGCRVSDLYRMTRQNIVNDAIEYIPSKTKEGNPQTVRVPLNEKAKVILKRYDDPSRKAILPFISEQKYNQAIGVDDVFGEVGYSTLERNSCRPSFDICGIWGGYTGEGSKTVLPSKAFAKVSCRLVANQDHEKISRAFIDYMQTLAPKGVRVHVTPMHGGQGYVCPIDIPAYKAAEKGFEIAFGKRPLAARRGGSIPIIAAFEKILGCKTILMGFGLEQNAIHSPNESMDLEVWERGIIAVTEFYKAYWNHETNH